MTKNLLRFSRIKLDAYSRHWELPFKNQWDMDKNHWLFRDWLTIAMFYHHRSPPWVLFIQKSLSVRYWSLMKLSLLVDNYQGSFDKSENPLFPVPRQNRNDITIVILTHVIDRVNFSKAFPCFLKFTSLLQLIPYFCVSCYFRMQYIQFTAGLPNGGSKSTWFRPFSLLPQLFCDLQWIVGYFSRIATTLLTTFCPSIFVLQTQLSRPLC